MQKWLRSMSIKDILCSDSSDEYAQEAAKKVLERLNKTIPEGDDVWDFALEDIKEQFADVETCEDFNAVLTELYDWADCGKRLWVGAI